MCLVAFARVDGAERRPDRREHFSDLGRSRTSLGWALNQGTSAGGGLAHGFCQAPRIAHAAAGGARETRARHGRAGCTRIGPGARAAPHTQSHSRPCRARARSCALSRSSWVLPATRLRSPVSCCPQLVCRGGVCQGSGALVPAVRRLLASFPSLLPGPSPASCWVYPNSAVPHYSPPHQDPARTCRTRRAGAGATGSGHGRAGVPRAVAAAAAAPSSAAWVVACSCSCAGALRSLALRSRCASKEPHGFLCPGCGVLVPVRCPCPLPFGARPMPVPATLRCPPHARARYPSAFGLQCPPHARALLWALLVRYS